MSNTDYYLLVQNILDAKIISDFEALSREVGMIESEFQNQLKQKRGKNLSDFVKFKLLNLSGVMQLSQAIRLVESNSEVKFSGGQFIDKNTKLIRWLEALDSLKNELGFIEDKQLADYLKIPSSTLSDFRRGKSEISGRIKLRILDHLGFHSIASGLEFFLRDEMAAAAKRARQRQARKIAEKNSNK